MKSNLLIAFLFVGFSLLVMTALPTSVEAEESFCEVCSNDLCLPVLDAFGFQNCTPGHHKLRKFKDPITGEVLFTWVEWVPCQTSSSCIVPPPS